MVLLSPLILLPLVAFLLSCSLHAATLTLFPRWKLLDFPKRYGLTRAPIPYPAGIVIVLLFCIFFSALFPLTLQNIGLLAGIVVLAACSFADDRTPLPPYLRIAVQILVAFILVFTGTKIAAVTNPLPSLFGPESSIVLQTGTLGLAGAVFTVGWLLFTINALNWFDGIPGQVSTLSVIGFVTIGCLSLSDRVNQPALGLLAFILAGLCLGALLFDLSPPKLLMGDTGAMFIGLMIGVLTIYSGGKVATAFLVLGVPLIDLLFVLVRRLAARHPLWKGDAKSQHLHHRLLAKGWTPRQIIALTAGIGALFGITALFLSTWGKVLAGGILLLVMLALSLYSAPRSRH